MRDTSSLPRAGLLHLGVIYTVWGSTYLAFRIGVGPGGGFEPFWMGALRFLSASLILLAFAALQGWRLRLSGTELGMLALSGVVLWVGGNGLILIASQWAASGYAALLVGTTPIWAALIEAFLDRRRPSGLMVAGLLVGLAGTAVLSVPKLEAASHTTFLAIVLLLISPMLWSAGTVYSQRRQPPLEPGVVSAYQQLFGGLAFLILSPLIGEHWTDPSSAGWGALVYLIVFGSLIAYTSFVLAVRLLPLSLVTTYAYVNPVVALILGWLVLREPINTWTVTGSALILLGVGLVFRSRALLSRP
jgi:drug/metabolite transporter (DMT)-like permease